MSIRDLFLVNNEDMELEHVLQREWDDSSADWHWARFDDTHDCGFWHEIVWSHWGFGPEITYYEHYQWEAFVGEREKGQSHRWNHWDFMLSIGPLHIGLQWHVRAPD